MEEGWKNDCEIEEFIFARNKLVFAVEMWMWMIDIVRMWFGMYSGVISNISMKNDKVKVKVIISIFIWNDDKKGEFNQKFHQK